MPTLIRILFSADARESGETHTTRVQLLTLSLVGLYFSPPISHLQPPANSRLGTSATSPEADAHFRLFVLGFRTA